MHRREFLTGTAKSMAAAGLSVPLFRLAQTDTPTPPPGKPVEKRVTPEYRILGKTGLKVTTIGYGAMRTRDEAVIHRALDLGINYIDTARGYLDGQSETIIGNVLKTRRKETFIATKFKPNTLQNMLRLVDDSLKALRVDCVDVIQAHSLTTVESIQHPDTMEILTKVKKEGKARFIGFTTHRNQTELVKAATPMNFYDTILVSYNFQSPPELTAAIEAAAKTGIGIVAMKTQAGGYADANMGNLSPHQAALKWVLQNKGVTMAIPSMVNYDQLSEDVQVMGSAMGWLDRKTLYRYGQSIDKTYCRMCNRCQDQCPQGVDVQDVNRSVMYHEGYGDPELAFGAYCSIPEASRPTPCVSCRTCSVRCSHGLDIHAKMSKALKLFA